LGEGRGAGAEARFGGVPEGLDPHFAGAVLPHPDLGPAGLAEARIIVRVRRAGDDGRRGSARLGGVGDDVAVEQFSSRFRVMLCGYRW